MSFQSYITKVRSALNLIPQPNNYTCQSAAICMVTKEQDKVMDVRAELERMGNPGDPYTMGVILKRSLGNSYKFYDDTSLAEVREWLKQGAAIITHGWFSRSGHVIVLNGVDIDTGKLSYRFHVLDPYAEFMARSWSYNNAKGYDGHYSSYLIYATCVVGQSYWDAEKIYRRGELDSKRKGMWAHVCWS